MRSRWFIGAVVAGVAAIAIAAVISRVKHDDSASAVTTTEWASAVCTDLADWKSSITLLASVSGGTLTKASLQQKLGDAKTATEQLVGELKALGKPDLAAGDHLKQQLSSSADELNATYESLQAASKEAESADTSKAFLQGLATLAPAFQKLLDEIQTTVSELQSAHVAGDAKTELQQAFDGAASCQSLRSGNG